MNTAINIPSPTSGAEGRSPRSGRRFWAFTLTPIVCVVLLVIVVVNFPTLNARSKSRQTAHVLASIQHALNAYRSENSTYPVDLATMVASGHLAPSVKDAWGRDFVYQPPAIGADPMRMTLRSSGPDGIPNTSDDLDAWNP